MIFYGYFAANSWTPLLILRQIASWQPSNNNKNNIDPI